MNANQLQKLAKLVSSLKSKVKCPVCLEHAEYTAELKCTHRLCTSCLKAVKLKSLPQCPICKVRITPRAPVYKDEFADNLSKFSNRVCQLIKEKYLFEVDEINLKKIDLQKVIDNAPQDIGQMPVKANIKEKENEIPEDAFDLLKGNQMKCYSNKKRQSRNIVGCNVLNFEDNDNKRKIIDWLNHNQEKLDLLTQQSQEKVDYDDEQDFQLPSSSQAFKLSRSKKHVKQRTTSLSFNENVSKPKAKQLIKRYKSLNNTCSEEDNEYKIEDADSQTFLKKNELRIVLNKLGNTSLNSHQNDAQLNQNESKSKLIKGKADVNHNKTTDSAASSGWKRLKKDQAGKGEKSKRKKPDNSPDGKNKEKNNDKKVFHITSHVTGDTEKISPLKNNFDKFRQKSYNLNAVEDYFEKHMEQVEISQTQKTLSDTEMPIECPADNIKKSKHESENNKELVVRDEVFNLNDFEPANYIAKDHFDEDMFNQPTQLSYNTYKSQKLHDVPSIPNDLNNIDDALIHLIDNLQLCLSSAREIQHPIGADLFKCFSNLLTYPNKISEIKSRRKSAAIQTIERMVNKRTSSTQTLLQRSFEAVATQTNRSPNKINKLIQTETQKVSNVYVQTSQPILKEVSINEKSVGNDLVQSIASSSSSPIPIPKRLNNKPIVSSSSNTSKSSKPPQISVDESKENKPSDPKNITSQESVLICSLGSSDKSKRKVNKKLTYEECENRTFKRIRKPASDSDSDDNGNPSKRKFIRDDLSIEFEDSAKTPCEKTTQYKPSTPESEKMDYDQYLLEVMSKYDPEPPKQQINLPNRDMQKTIPNKQLEKINSPTTQSLSHSNHTFTQFIAAPENLDRFDREIKDFQQNILNTYNTESDLIENTPLGTPKRKMFRLSKKGDSVDTQIISKGVAMSSSKSTKVYPPIETENYFDKELTALNRNIQVLPTQTEQLAKDDVSEMLEDLRKDNEFFKIELETEEKDTKDKPNLKSKEANSQRNPSQRGDENLIFEVDQDIERELQQSFYSNSARSNNKINILQNITLISPQKNMPGDEFLDVIESSDVSDDEFVQGTPQKDKPNSFNRSHLGIIVNSPENDMNSLDLCLPPPPEFDDAPMQKNPIVSQTENCTLAKANVSSLTPGRLSDFIVTPGENFTHSHKEEFKRSFIFNTPFITPKKDVKPKSIATPKITQPTDESESVFSPISKNPLKLIQNKYTPLVSTPRSLAKKPTIMTSTPHQKSILNYVVPSQDSPAMPKSKPCIMWSRIMHRDLTIFTQLENKKLLNTSQVFSSRVTHLVVLVDEKGRIVSHTAKILQAIAAGIWVVRYEWAEDCLKMNRIVSEEPYEALDTTGEPGPRKARLVKATSAKRLFDGFLFYCAPPFENVSKADLEIILHLSGGQTVSDLGAFLEKKGKIHIILTESSEETEPFDDWLQTYKAVTVGVEWLSDCIGQYKLVSFRPYLVLADETMICDLGYPQNLVESVSLTAYTEGI